MPEDFTVSQWSELEPYFQELASRPIASKADLEKWLQDQSELEAVVVEDGCWRQIKMTCDTENEELQKSFNDFCLNIQPNIQPYSDKLNKKLIESPFLKELDQDVFLPYIRNTQKNIELFREANISLQSEAAILQQQYGQITGAMIVEINGNEYTLQQAGKFLENKDRAVRENAYRKIQERRAQDVTPLNELFDKLLSLRNQIAVNAGFDSFIDYRFKELGRFDYTPADCSDFHEAVKLHVLPLVKEIYLRKKEKLKVDTLRPWDLNANPEDVKSLHPFEHSDELIEKSITCFNKLHPFFGDCLAKMRSLKHLDLDSRKGKAPGGYNCPLPESGAPFIFMNASGQMHDVTTMMHEGGHAIHSFLSHQLPLTGFKEYPTEMAEVASMSMEFFSMDHWDVFFSDEEDLRTAKEHQLERTITLFPWIAMIDKFQFWIYSNPGHTLQQRSDAWMAILKEFHEGVVDYSGLEQFQANSWQRQLHLYEVPFYYIEYGIAQLGAINMWMQYKTDPKKTLDNYCKALSLGGTKTLPELYKAAGFELDFSPEKVKNLMEFVHAELNMITA